MVSRSRQGSATDAAAVEFVSSSRRGETRRGRLLLGSVSVAAIVALVLAGVAVWQRREADDQRREAESQRREAVQQRNTAEERRLAAESQRLAVESKAELATDPEIALILASDGYRASPTAQATTALRQSLDASLVRSTLSSAVKVRDLAPAASGLTVTDTVGRAGTLVARRGADVVSTLDFGRPVSSSRSLATAPPVSRSRAIKRWAGGWTATRWWRRRGSRTRMLRRRAGPVTGGWCWISTTGSGPTTPSAVSARWRCPRCALPRW